MTIYGQSEDPNATPLEVDSNYPTFVTFSIRSDWTTNSADLTEQEVLELLVQLWEWVFDHQLIKKRKETKNGNP